MALDVVNLDIGVAQVIEQTAADLLVFPQHHNRLLGLLRMIPNGETLESGAV